MTYTHGSIVIPQGCDYEFTINVTDENGLAVDLSEYKARFRVADKKLKSRYIDFTADETPDKGTCTVNSPEVGTIAVVVKPHSSVKLPSNNEVGEESTIQANNVYSVVIIKNPDAEVDPGEIIKVVQGDCYIEVEL